jgi:hypothetical protein
MSHHPTIGSYLLTEDLGEKVTGFRHVGLETPSATDPFFDDIQQQLASALSSALGEEHPVIRLKMRDVADGIIGEIARVHGDDVFIVSTCPEIAYPAKGATVEVNRLVDTYGNALGLGPRPGHVAISQQFRKIVAESRASGTKGIVVAEDGMFMGETMMYVVSELIKAGGNVLGVVVGFTFGDDSIAALNALDVQVNVVQDFRPILDWVPDHDFMPFIPGCGKVLGVNVRSLGPFYDHQHATFCVPYIAPFGPVNAWASIPEEKVNAFSTECINLTIQVFETLEKMNRRAITIGTILQSRQRVGIPISLDKDGETHGGFPTKDARVITFLGESL